MTLEFEPSQHLSFRGPLTQHSESTLTLTNTGSQLVAYKIKTTAPKQYCVKPNAGRINANSSVSIQVISQPFKEEPTLDFKCKDKFLIQSVALTPDNENMGLTDLWTTLENGPKDKISQKKLRCVFLSENEEAQADQSGRADIDGNEEYTNASPSRPNSQENLNNSQDPSRLRQELADARETIQRMQKELQSAGSKSLSKVSASASNVGYPAYIIFIASFIVAALTWYFTNALHQQ
ncbi:hypothetical protein INT43_006547 [Umbelopsis isabellina]|uniref:MSP domain-containing protein n=1 Tax=Mortierella isabellina TaxID=91625 RepID=A0A8H7Q2L9_MORIS|nr:hypothetical protein INT43_006547 [Umbelopsis isabellina]